MNILSLFSISSKVTVFVIPKPKNPSIKLETWKLKLPASCFSQQGLSPDGVTAVCKLFTDNDVLALGIDYIIVRYPYKGCFMAQRFELSYNEDKSAVSVTKHSAYQM